MSYIYRALNMELIKSVKTRPLVYLNGARQCGKSTLVRNALLENNINYISFDSPILLAAAKRNPANFIVELPQNKINVIDEVQLATEIFPYLKIDVDEKRIKGKNKSLYVLTGSANIFALPKLANALVGRMTILTLYPFSVSEFCRKEVNFIDKFWNIKLTVEKYKNTNLLEKISNATFPEIALDENIDREKWFDGYLTTILQRDAASLASIRRPEKILQLLISFSERVGSLINDENIKKETGSNSITYERYKAFCNSVFMTFEVQPWSKPNKLDKRFLRSKKIYFTDTNFLCYIMRRELKDLYTNPSAMGHIFENFIASEIIKAASSSPNQYFVSHFNPVRGQGKEVDFIIENSHGEAIAIEIKLNATLDLKDFANMKICKDTLRDKFKKGIVVYTGNEILPFGDNLWAIPVNYLWER
ncbi:MAG: ATP-binding protein [Endomicrobium sp.]|nr:ATP-binding protein [Endomicrobium sp.]